MHEKNMFDSSFIFQVGLTPIQCAILNGHQEIVHELSKTFANINDVNEVRLTEMYSTRISLIAFKDSA